MDAPDSVSPRAQAANRIRIWLRSVARRLLAALVVVILITVAAAFAGVQPLAHYKDTALSRAASLVEMFDRDQSAAAYPVTQRFNGTYRTNVPVLGYEQSLTFRDDTLTIVDDYAGTLVYRYTATMESESDGVLQIEDVRTGAVTDVPFHYIPEADCLIVYSQGRDREGVTYCG